MTEKVPIGFIGLGAMGEAMARVLMRAGYPLRVYNRTPGKANALVAEGAGPAASPADAATAGGVAITMVADDGALEEVTLGPRGIAGRLGEGGLHLSMSTVSPELSRRLASAHAERDELFVAAPVFGRPPAAAAGKLRICFSGSKEGVERARPLLSALGQGGVFDFGADPGAASVVKLGGNFLIMAMIEGLAEMYTLADRNGIGVAGVNDFVTGTLFASPMYQMYGQLITESRFEPPGFRLRLGLKDIDLALAAAESSGVPMPFASLIRERLADAVDSGRGEIDVSGLTLGVREAAGM